MNTIYHVEKKVFSYIEKYHMIAPGGKIVAGVSGGADSVCMLFLLLEYGRRVPISIGVVHVNHGFRADAGEDARYVEDLCRQYDIPFYLTEADVRELAAQEKCSEEDAGRRVRYRAFYQAADAMGGARIAVAHNIGDNAETMLFHLFRGSGLKGLCGIAPVRDAVIHPILCLERREVEAYLRQRGISWRTDSTNGEDHYRRNRIRHHILPYAESEVAQGATAHMCGTAEFLSEVEDYLEQQTRAAWERCVKEQPKASGWSVSPVAQEQPGASEQSVNPVVQERSGVAGQSVSVAVKEQPGAPGQCISAVQTRYTVDISLFRELHIVLQKRILLGIAKALSPTGKDISAVHVEDVLSLFEKPGNRDLNLPFGIWAGRRYGEVVLERRDRETVDQRFRRRLKKQGFSKKAVNPDTPESSDDPANPEKREFSEAARNPDGWEVQLPTQGYPVTIKLENGESLEFNIFSEIKGQEVPRNQYTKWLDYDKMIESPVIRFRRQGDFLTIADREGRLIHKTLKDYMITEKIPREQREKIPVLAVGSHVVWLVGYRISEYFKVGENTNHILQVQLKKGFTVSETEEENVGTH